MEGERGWNFPVDRLLTIRGSLTPQTRADRAAVLRKGMAASRADAGERSSIMTRDSESMPPERATQFRVIHVARVSLLERARSEGVHLEHVEYVVPFVETDFTLSAWLFYSSEEEVTSYLLDGTSDRMREQLKSILVSAGYPMAWLPGVECYFASKERVDACFEGSYRNYVR